MEELHEVRHLFGKNRPLFNALGDTTRQNLLLQLLEGAPMSVQELTDMNELSRPAISHHLKILKDAGLLEEQHRGAKRYYHPIVSDQLQPLRELLTEVDRLLKLKNKGDE